jgi:hypothetical protein
MPGRVLTVNTAAVSLIGICILAAALLVTVTSSEQPAVVTTAAVTTPTTIVHTANAPTARAVESQQDSAAAANASQPTSPSSKPVTITGCLEREGNSFRLVDTTGAAAPKSRTWKSGFLKKGNGPVAVVDTGKRLNLSRHVNERVDVTGILSAKTLQARSVARVSKTCP